MSKIISYQILQNVKMYKMSEMMSKNIWLSSQDIPICFENMFDKIKFENSGNKNKYK